MYTATEQNDSTVRMRHYLLTVMVYSSVLCCLLRLLAPVKVQCPPAGLLAHLTQIVQITVCVALMGAATPADKVIILSNQASSDDIMPKLLYRILSRCS